MLWIQYSGWILSVLTRKQKVQMDSIRDESESACLVCETMGSSPSLH